MKNIKLKSAREIQTLREGGKILSDILKQVAMAVKAGTRGEDLDEKAMKLAAENGAACSFYRFLGFPAHICLSLNDEVVHGLPFGKIIREGDLVSIDLGIKYKKLFTDSSVSFVVPGRNKSANSLSAKERLVRTTLSCLRKTLKYCRTGYRLGDIGFSIQKQAEEMGYSVVKKLVGHGVGYAVHENPFVPNYGSLGKGERLRPGMVLAIEPMINEGSEDVRLDQKNGWSYRTADGKLSAHFEWSVAITHKDPIVLTPLNWFREFRPAA
ncbi:MAG: type I methionyl aminopeptidase [Candidatus Moranbacteria bacterium]|nr:type I methionyl aminopeptidase [Candidatus Moranbacteria bacterium]